MRVLFLISPGGVGLGGHNYSFRTIVESLRTRVLSSVVSIGSTVSPVLRGIPGIRSLVLKPLSLRELSRQLWSLTSEEPPDVIHAFDTRAYYFARRLGLRIGCPVVLTKCGGSNPTRYFPLCDDLVLFSKENLDWFKQRRRFGQARLHWIPNRVVDPPQDRERIAKLRLHLPSSRKVVLRIARISPTYEQSIMQTINLARELRRRSVPVAALIVGNVLDGGVLARIQAAVDRDDRVITDRDFTQDASALLDVADLVVGTGRGFMEGAARGRVMLAPVRSAALPALVTNLNWEQLFWTNFSERGSVGEPGGVDALDSIAQALGCEDARASLQQLARSLFDEYFCVESGVPRYLSIYSSAAGRAAHSRVDLWAHGLQLRLKEIVRQVRRTAPVSQAGL